MPLVLAIEPDTRQGGVLERIVRDHVRAELLLVDSPDAAVASLATRIPDVILVSMLLAPADEEDLIERLRSLDGGRHIQTYTIPQFASTPADADDASGRFLGTLRKKKGRAVAQTPGCDPDLFATEIVTFLSRAQELKEQSEGDAARMLRLSPRDPLAQTPAEGAPDGDMRDAADPEDSSWASPFEWRRTSAGRQAATSTNARVDHPQPPAGGEPEHPGGANVPETDERAATEERLRLEASARAEETRLDPERQAALCRLEEDRLAELEEADRRERDSRDRAEAEAAREREAEALRLREEEEASQRAEAVRRAEEAEVLAQQERHAREAAAAAAAEREREEREPSKQAAEAEHGRQQEAGAPELPERAPRFAELAQAPAEAVADPEQIRRERLAAAQETAQRRREEKARKAALAKQSRRAARPQASATIPDRHTGEPPARSGVADPYAEFREDRDRPRGPLRLLPVDAWAHVAPSAAPNVLEPSPLHGLIAGLSVPADVAVISYPRGCRIRRVRVRTIPITDDDLRETVIVSRSALDASRAVTQADHR